MNWNPDEGIEDEESMIEPSVGDGGFGLSSLPIR